MSTNPRFVVFSCGRNVSNWIENHYKSLSSQTYQNFIHIVVDDASNENTNKLRELKLVNTFLYRNTEQWGWLWNATHYLTPFVSDDDIVFILDLDDWLYHDKVFETYTKIYSEDVWLTYGRPYRTDGSHVDIDIETYGRDVAKHKQYRAERWLFRAPRTFRGFLWKAIKVEDLKDADCKYPMVAYDFAIGFPLLEMTPFTKLRYVPDFHYVYNIHSMNDKVVMHDEQKKVGNYFRTKLPYQTYDEQKVWKHNRMIVFSCGWNCSKWIDKHMLSIQQQSYENFVHVIVDDASTDKTSKVVRNFLFEHKDIDNVFLHRQTTNQKWLANATEVLDEYIHDDEDIIVVVDLDDWLAHCHVLEEVNRLYNESQCWITYGAFVSSDGKRIRPEHCEKKKREARVFQQMAWGFTHLKTFKAFLWRSIDKEDFKVNGTFVSCCYDRALMYPMFYMTPSDKIKCILDPLYILNTENPLRTKTIHREEQITLYEYFTKKKSYKHYSILRR